MKLIVLAQYYPPEIGSSQVRMFNLVSHFAKAGHEVSVITAMPNYPAGKIHPGYGGLLQRTRENGVNVIRTFIFPSQSLAMIPRLANYFSFVLSSALFGSFMLGPADYLLVDSPPLFSILAGAWLSRLKHARLIFNIADLWPETALRLGVVQRKSRAYRWSLRLESFGYRHAWLVTGQSHGILQNIATRFPGKHTFLLSNGADTTAFHPNRRTNDARSRLAGKGEFVVLYAGLHGLAQNLDQILNAARVLSCETGYRFVFIGDGPEKRRLMLTVQQKGIENVTFMDPVPNGEIPPLLASADLVLVPLATHIPGAIPSKLYEAMASGRPTVLVAGGEAAEIVRQYEAGIVVEPGDVTALAGAIQEMRSNHHLAYMMAENARAAAAEHFDRSEIAQSFIQYLAAQLRGSTLQPKEGCKSKVA
jgi:colanic acid biosynthesis glycosyl transferase WcaI